MDDGTWVDLGGQWVGWGQDRLLALIAEHGLESFPTWTNGKNQVEVDGRAKRYRGTIPRLPVLDLLNVGEAIATFARLYAGCGAVGDEGSQAHRAGEYAAFAVDRRTPVATLFCIATLRQGGT